MTTYKTITILLFISFVSVLYSCGGDEPKYISEVNVFVKNATEEPVYILIKQTTQKFTTKDFWGWGNLHVPLVEPGEKGHFGTSENLFFSYPYVTIIIFKESTVKRFSKEEILKYDIYDECYSLTYFELAWTYDFNITYHGYSHWQENELQF